ncbi:DNA-directed RNA polymerase V subunit 1-like [Magnolia sinica]|uniref:DNA-directed RNA polymerase V subunit 1-like n=1 Tax=Magnolia sinica TaxID=86752 RepID=UPI00265A0A1C|nr:DNA-directed RNA polymerase V subunit 1-like [Magnolia sinica]
MFRTFFLNKATAQQLAMCVSPVLPEPALLKAHRTGPLWTVLQIVQSALPAFFDCFGERHLISKSEMVRIDFNRDLLQSSFTEIVTSVLDKKGTEEAIKFFNMLQPLLMEILFLEGYSVGLNDFDIPKAVTEDIKKKIQDISPLLLHLRSNYNELVELQVESYLKTVKLPIMTRILKLSAFSNLIDSKNDSAISKVVQQLGFLGLQLYDRGKFYSRRLVEDMSFHFQNKYFVNGVDYPSEAFGLVKSSFFQGLTPYEELVHSISSREVLIRSSGGLTEPGTLFKNLTATLRDVIICYDGTVRNLCSNSIIQFEYGQVDENSPGSSLAGEPVGVLAATAVSNPAYKAVLDSSQSNNSSWESMKEILLCKVNFKNDIIDRRVILYLNECFCGKMHCKEHAAYLVQNRLKKVTLKDVASDFSIEYQRHRQIPESSEADTGLVGHIHLDKMHLKGLDRSMDEILHSCQEVINCFGRKKHALSPFFKKIYLSSCKCCTLQQQCDEKWSQLPCLQFFYKDGNGGLQGDMIEKTLQIMAEAICPILLGTLVNGDPRVHMANIIWIGSDSTTWVRNDGKFQKGEVAVEVGIEKDVAKKSGDGWRVAMDSCLPVMHLIDTRRSTPYGVQQIQKLLGISCPFGQSVQRLSTSIKMVAKGMLKEHLMLLANIEMNITF